MFRLLLIVSGELVSVSLFGVIRVVMSARTSHAGRSHSSVQVLVVAVASSVNVNTVIKLWDLFCCRWCATMQRI